MSSGKTFKITLILLAFVILPQSTGADDNLALRLGGKILIQAEALGQAWYVYPGDFKRYSLGKPSVALSVMQKLGKGITNGNLEKIPVGISKNSAGADEDGDGLSDIFEEALGTDKNKIDTDGDGYPDKVELENGYNPNGAGKPGLDLGFAKKHMGTIFLQVEKSGEAWYVNPSDLKRYYLGRPDDALNIMREFGLGISEADLLKIPAGIMGGSPPAPSGQEIPNNTGVDVINLAAAAIRAKNKTAASSYFVPEMKNRVEYAVENMNSDSLLLLGNILSSSSIKNQGEEEIVYKNDVWFSLGGYEVPLEFRVKKQPDGSWLMANL